MHTARHSVAVIVVVYSYVVVTWVVARRLSSSKNAVSQMRRHPWTFFDNPRHKHWRRQFMRFQVAEVLVALFRFEPRIQNAGRANPVA